MPTRRQGFSGEFFQSLNHELGLFFDQDWYLLCLGVTCFSFEKL